MIFVNYKKYKFANSFSYAEALPEVIFIIQTLRVEKFRRN
jgi:hypothetical protein